MTGRVIPRAAGALINGPGTNLRVAAGAKRGVTRRAAKGSGGAYEG